MDTNEIVKKLSSSPIKQIDELPVMTKNVILPFKKLMLQMQLINSYQVNGMAILQSLYCVYQII